MTYSNVLAFLGLLLHYLGLALVVPGSVALIYGEHDAMALALTALLSLTLGLMLRWKRKVMGLSHRDAFAIVSLGWIAVAAIGALPFVFSGAIPSYVDALFEATSGVTTTGATVIEDVESLPHGLLLWRSMLQWLGGMGFIVLSLALLPQLAVGGMELFKAEVPTPIPERLKPRLRETSMIMWRIYIGLTVTLAILLLAAGMNWFDAVSHALVTIPTGGFSTRTLSIAAYNSVPIELILGLFMLLSGANFSLYHRALDDRRLSCIWRDPEFRTYLAILLAATGFMALNLWRSGSYDVLNALRHASFQAISIVTTTGFASADFNVWPAFATTILFGLMFVGGSAGSTAGGVKVMRHIVVVKHGYRELLRLIHPRAVRPVRVGSQSISESVIARVLAFLLLYLMLFAMGTLVIVAHGVEMRTAAAAVAASLGNVGPSLGGVGPMATYAWLPPTAKLVVSFLMVVGRLEIYTVLVLLLPATWARSRRAPSGMKNGSVPRPDRPHH